MQDNLPELLDRLWAQFCGRVPYARQYRDMVLERGGTVQNDHIALRTLDCNTGAQPAGIEAMRRVFEPLGYEERGQYVFKEKKLSAVHFEHKVNPDFPKIFVSELKVDLLSPETARLIKEAVEDTPDLLTGSLYSYFDRPWQPPLRQSVFEVNKESQYAAWTLLHGNRVNHFTAYINAQQVPEWDGIEGTVAALRAAGIPMKAEIEGERGSKLRQSSTEAAEMRCEVREKWDPLESTCRHASLSIL